MYKLEFEMDPVAKGRPRFTKSGHAYTPEKTRYAEAELRLLMSAIWVERKLKPLQGPLNLAVHFQFARPKSVSLKKRPYHIVKPDLDNALKMVKDAANRILWRDDSQIVAVTMMKTYGTTGKLWMTIEEIGND